MPLRVQHTPRRCLVMRCGAAAACGHSGAQVLPSLKLYFIICGLPMRS